MKYEINEENKKNLLIFLARVQLTGQEVPAFNSVLNDLNSPIKEEKKTDGNKN